MTPQRRLNVEYLSVMMGDHLYVWRSCWAGNWGPLIRFGDRGWEARSRITGQWLSRNDGFRTRDGERFIRVGQVIP